MVSGGGLRILCGVLIRVGRGALAKGRGVLRSLWWKRIVDGRRGCILSGRKSLALWRRTVATVIVVPMLTGRL